MVLDDIYFVSEGMVLKICPVDVNSKILVVPSSKCLGNLLLEIRL